jgi:hypothetical protein
VTDHESEAITVRIPDLQVLDGIDDTAELHCHDINNPRAPLFIPAKQAHLPSGGLRHTKKPGGSEWVHRTILQIQLTG